MATNVSSSRSDFIFCFTFTDEQGNVNEGNTSSSYGGTKTIRLNYQAITEASSEICSSSCNDGIMP